MKKLTFVFIIIYLFLFGFVTFRYYTAPRYVEFNVASSANIKTGENSSIDVWVKNLSYEAFNSDSGYLISYHLYDKDNNLIAWDNIRTDLGNIAPSFSETVRMSIEPIEKAGEYLIEIDVVKEGHFWFKDKENKTAICRLIVS